jgi:hypothetical protein
MRRLLVPLTALGLLGVTLAGCRTSTSGTTDCNCGSSPSGSITPVPLVIPQNGQPPKMPVINGADKDKKAIEEVPAPQEKEKEKEAEKAKDKDLDLPVPPKF